MILVLVVLAFFVYAAFLPNTYVSEATIAIASEMIPKDYVLPSDDSNPEEQISAVGQLIKSRSFMERLIQDFQLFGYGSSRYFSMDYAAKAAEKSIQILVTSKNTFKLSFSANTPQIAQTFTKRIVEMIIQSNNSSRKTKAEEAYDFLNKQLHNLSLELSDLNEKIQKAKRSNPVPEKELLAFSRDYALLNQQYAALYNKTFQSRLTAELASNKNNDSFRIIDEPSLPDKAVSPNRMHLMLAGLTLGLVLGIGIALGQESRNSTPSK